jgi:hypothetical protein
VFKAAACVFAASGGEVVRTIDAYVVEVESNQVVVTRNGLSGECVEDSSIAER